MVIFLARQMGAQLHELKDIINSQVNGQLLAELWNASPMAEVDRGAREEGDEGRSRLNKYFGKADALLSKIRNKQAYHIDQKQMEIGFEHLPNDVAITEFHTRMRGTTFYGSADAVALYATAALGEMPDGFSAVQRLMAEANEVFGYAADFIEAYMLAFSVTYFGRDRMRNAPVEILKNVPLLNSSRLHFFFRVKRPKGGM